MALSLSDQTWLAQSWDQLDSSPTEILRELIILLDVYPPVRLITECADDPELFQKLKMVYWDVQELLYGSVDSGVGKNLLRIYRKSLAAGIISPTLVDYYSPEASLRSRFEP